MSGLELLVSKMSKNDIRQRTKLGEDLMAFLEEPENSLEGEDTGALIDGLILWLGSSNSKIQQIGLEILSKVVVRLREDFRPYISSVLPACVDRMGDSKEVIRDTNADVLNKMMEVTSPQYILDKLTGAFTHKNYRVRDEILLLLQDTVIRYTASSLQLSKFIPGICKLMDDPNAQVRETSMTTLVVIYKYVGDRLRHDLQRKYEIQPSKMQVLLERFDKAIESGEMVVPPSSEDHQMAHVDEVDRMTPKPKSGLSAKKPALPAKPAAVSTLGRSKPAVSSGPAGAVDEDTFIEGFQDVPRINLYSAKELDQVMNTIKQTISNTEADWDKRLTALKQIRSVMLAGAKDYDEFLPLLKSMELPLASCVKDLRSQIVREACITVAYLCVQLNTKMDRICEQLLPSLIFLIGASVKIMSTSGVVCIRFVIKHVHSHRLVPVIIQNLASKNKEIRRQCFEFLNELLVMWPTYTLERHIAILQQAIKVGLSDADQEARSHARKAFWSFAEHFKAQADSLLFSLDSNKQKMLHGHVTGAGGMSSSSSSSSINNLGRSAPRPGFGNSMESLRAGAGSRGSGHLASTSRVPKAVPSRRSNSAIDMAAARSSRLKAFTKTPSSGYGYGLSLPRSTVKATRAESVCSTMTSPERTPQNRGRQVSQSQPNSRSASPSSRFSYATYGMADGRRRSRIPTATSRDPSPSRSIGSQSSSSLLSDRRRSSLSRYPTAREVTIVPSTPTAAERLLRNSREAEERMADALRSTPTHSPLSSYARQHSFGFHRDDSDASSIASDRSYRHDDVPEILANLASVHWSDRKDGLSGLLALLRNQSHALSDPDLQKVTQTLTKMFMDPHTKVFTLFLDTLNELITVHSSDLHRIGFLSVLLTKLFIKTGTDLLGSVLTKILRTMDLIRDSFPHLDQFTVITRFLNDPAHSSSSPKVKISVLKYLESLTKVMDSSELPSNDPNMRDTLLKVTQWAGDTKNSELQQRSRSVIASLYKVKTPYFSTVINQMAPDFQRTALDVIQNELKHASIHHGSENVVPLSPLGTPTRTRLQGFNASPQRSFEDENSENLRANPSLRLMLHQEGKSFDDDSSDSIKRTGSSPRAHTPRLEELSMSPLSIHSGNNPGSASERLQHCVQLLSSPMNSSEQKRSALAELQILVKDASLWETESNFKSVLRVLLGNLTEDNGVKYHSLKTLAELVKKQPQHVAGLADLAIVRVLEVAKEKDKDVVKMSDSVMHSMVLALPAPAVSRTVASIIAGAMQDPGMLCVGIKSVQRIVDHYDAETVRDVLPVLGPVLIKTYDHQESSVRKASVFCMVNMYNKAGKEAMHPYTSHLPGCKLRLLNLYIERAAQQSQNGSGVPGDTSPSTCSNASNL